MKRKGTSDAVMTILVMVIIVGAVVLIMLTIYGKSETELAKGAGSIAYNLLDTAITPFT
jgi:hypothetical protein